MTPYRFWQDDEDLSACHELSGWALQVLGLLVSWSTFLMIGATSGLTFNVVGNLKLIIVLAGGVVFFGDVMPPKKFAGVCLALAGIFWYSYQVRLMLTTSLGEEGQQTSGLVIACLWCCSAS